MWAVGGGEVARVKGEEKRGDGEARRGAKSCVMTQPDSPANRGHVSCLLSRRYAETLAGYSPDGGGRGSLLWKARKIPRGLRLVANSIGWKRSC